MKVPNGFTVSLYVASAVVVIGLRVGNEFLISLCLHFLLCRIFSRVSSNNLLLVLTMGTIFSAEIMALRTLLPISWHAPVNLLYMLLINCFLCHYLIWSVLEFSLVDIEQEVLEIPTFSSLPTNSCLLVIMLGFSHLKKHMSLLACIVGVPTLWLCSRYKPQNHLERLWNFFMEICTAVLLNLFPFLNYIIFYFDAGEKSLCKFLVEILFLTATTNLILSQLHIQNLFSSNFYRSIVSVTSMLTGVLLLNSHTDFLRRLFSTPSHLPAFVVHLFIFLILTSMICLEFYHRSIKTRYVLKCISVLLFFIVIGLYWNSLSSTLQTSQYPLWNRRFINQLFWAGIVSLIFSIITLFAYGYGNQEIFDLSLGICLCVLHYSEWCLYMTVSISESWICISSTINIIFVLLGSANMKQSSLQKSAFAIANRGSAIKLFRWHVLSACCLVPAFLKLALLWINKYIDDSSTHNTLNHRVHFEKGFVLGLYLMILGFICSERMYLCVRELAAQLLKFPIFVTCFTQFHAFIQSISMLAYFHSAVVLVWPQIVLFMYPKGELSLSSNNHVLIQFSCSCLMTSFALILPSVINSNTTSCEMYTQSRSIGKLGFLLLVWTINSRQLELNLPGVLVYVATIPTLICSAMWMICAFILLFSMQTFSLCLKSILVYLLKGVVVPNLLILSCSFYLLVSINIFPSNLAAYLMLSVYISCIVTLILWDTNDHRIAGLLHCPSTDYHAATMKYTTNNRNSDFSLPFYKSNKPMSYSANKPEPGQSAVPDIYCHLFVRLIVLCCGLVCSFGLPIYLTYPMRVPIETVCQLYSLVSLQIFCIAQISVGYPQRWLCDKIQCRSVRLFNNGSNGVLYLILVCLVNFCVILAVILRLQFCPSFTTDIEVFFLPWIIFTLHGKLLSRYRHVLALACFTTLLVYMAFINSPIVQGYSPPLPTFDRQLFGRSNSPFYSWCEFLLTIALIPLHILFLADQSNLSTQTLVDIFFFYRFGQSHTQHLPSSFCLKCLKVDIAHCLSYIFAYILCTDYVLLPFCISYWFIASSFASAIFGFYSFIICIYLLLRVDIVTEYY